PGIDGYETASRIRQFNKDVIIIAQTAFAMSDDKTRCIQAGCNNYISKPINYHELYEMLESYTG
ncbi:MAG TPA: response regulator, partial [Bacteroidales bacterium]|nr:response regulator [Bacteroidales bacterium]